MASQFALLVLAIFAVWFAWRQPKSVDVHLAPDVRAGDTVHVTGAIPPCPSPMSTVLRTTSGSRSIAGKPMVSRTTGSKFSICSIT
nr:DUF2895 family protein [Delftia acidovorans]